jgi:RND family efflux transporter MFP subunit
VNPGRAIALTLVAAALLSGCSPGGGARAKGGGRQMASPNPIPTAAAKLTTVRATSTISGIIAPFQNVALSSSLSEPADAVNVNEGDPVSAGAVLAVLDTADLRAQLAQAQATVVSDQRVAESDDAKVTQMRYTARLNIGTANDQVKSAQAALAQAQHTLALDTANLKRDQSLLTGGYIAQQALDQQQTLVNNDQAAVRTAQANLQTTMTQQQVNGNDSAGLQAASIASAIADARAAHSVVDQARAQVQQLQTTISKATIVSPVDGVVVNRNLNPGEYPGSRTIFTLQELDRVYAELNASSSDTFAIPVGAPVSLSVSGGGNNAYQGRVVAVLGQVTPGSTDFTVKVLVQNVGRRLHSGLPVSATISLPPVRGVGIPTTAFLDDTHTTVMVADDELTDVVAKTTKVREVASDGTISIVTGVKAGQAVVANGQLGVTDGQSLVQN